jgi:protein phosphatase 1 regulatory subunit 7
MEKEKTPPPGDSPSSGEKPHLTPTDSKGWDGKLRVERRPVLHNPEAISDPEYSDEEHVVPGEEINADEGEFHNMQRTAMTESPSSNVLINRFTR